MPKYNRFQGISPNDFNVIIKLGTIGKKLAKNITKRGRIII